MEEGLLLLWTEDVDDVEDGRDFNVALGELFDLFKQGFWSLLRVEVGEVPSPLLRLAKVEEGEVLLPLLRLAKVEVGEVLLPLLRLAKVEEGEVLLPLLRLAKVEGNISSLSSSSNEEGRQDSNSSGSKASLPFW